MWQTDTVYLQTSVDTDTYGSIKQAWSRSTAVLCDVQEMDKEYAYRAFGLTDSTKYVQVFDLNNNTWVLGEQVEYLNEQWIIRKVISNLTKIGLSNHTYVVLSKVT